LSVISNESKGSQTGTSFELKGGTNEFLEFLIFSFSFINDKRSFSKL
jgi:hypothetical protein